MSFQRFYNTWLEQLHHLSNQLNQTPRPPTTDEDNHQLHQLVQKTVSHYAEYYCVKSIAAKQDILSVFAAPWATTLERSLHWIAGWRPTTAFHLIYTEASIRFESQIIDILRGLRNGDLSDLSPAQFRRVSELQCETVVQENAITDELSEWQACNRKFTYFSACLLHNFSNLIFCELTNFDNFKGTKMSNELIYINFSPLKNAS